MECYGKSQLFCFNRYTSYTLAYAGHRYHTYGSLSEGSRGYHMTHMTHMPWPCPRLSNFSHRSRHGAPQTALVKLFSTAETSPQEFSTRGPAAKVRFFPTCSNPKMGFTIRSFHMAQSKSLIYLSTMVIFRSCMSLAKGTLQYPLVI